MLNQHRNSTLGSCAKPYDSVYLVLNNILLFLSFPSTVLVIWKLLSRFYETGRFIPAEIFLLQINFINICVFISQLLIFQDILHAGFFSNNLYMVLFSPSLTARPIFLLAICVIFYLAIVHPVTYMTTKALHHWEWLVTALIWLYALAINLAIIFYKLDIFQPIFMLVLSSNMFPCVFFYIEKLRVLFCSRQTLNPVKRKAIRLILATLIVLFFCYIPRLYFLIYLHLAPNDWHRFLCTEGLVLMMLSKFSEVAMPVIFLYSLRRLDV
ncbi:hydroxycarboxylic acid receptor 2-like [Silurus asotus]|uniref:Hydroxycarboxylic acid receptor 2-like n=1 Tax=Silurus asotus TaxID=30991 RepID=A0AAD5B7T0_SILAS|nr:hydroxycarboxylic acid receptor 2-like [Silurus asotus]